MSNETVLLLWQFISAIAIPNIIQSLKGAKWFPFANFNMGTLNRLFSWTVAALTGLGLGFSFDHTAGTFTVTGLTLTGIIAGLTHMSTQIAANHAAYKILVAPPQSGLQQAIERDKEKAGIGSLPPLPPLPLPIPVKTFVGSLLPGTAQSYSVLPNDPTKVGDTVDVGGVKYLKLSEEVYQLSKPA